MSNDTDNDGDNTNHMDILSDVNINGKIFLGNENVYINNYSGVIQLVADRVATNIFCVCGIMSCPDVRARTVSFNGSEGPHLEFHPNYIKISNNGKNFILTDLTERPLYGHIEYISVPAQCSKFVVSQSEFYAPLVQAYKRDGKQVEMDYTYNESTGCMVAELTPFSEETNIMFRIF